MKRRLAIVILGASLCGFACTRSEQGDKGGPPPPGEVVGGGESVPPPAAVPVPALPEAGEPGDNAGACLALVGAKKYDVALRPCLIALQADTRNPQLVAAVKEIQASVTNPQPTAAAAGTPQR